MIDMRDNKLEYNGFLGGPYWNAIYEHIEKVPALIKIISGAHSVINMHIAHSWIENSQTNKHGIFVPG